MKKGLKFVGVVALSILSMASCTPKAGGKGGDDKVGGKGGDEEITVGLIALEDSNSTYDKNFIDAFRAAADKVGVEPIVTTKIGEDDGVTTAANNMIQKGAKFIFADSFGHETYLANVAAKNPGVQFGHASGDLAHTKQLANFTNAFASIYEGRYLAGVAAGLKLQAMGGTNHHVGYVGAYDYAEVISGFTSWFLGVRSVVADATMTVRYTGSWYNQKAEQTTANTLITDDHCALISQHADSMGAPTACETAGVPNVTYNGSTEASCPKTYIISSKINWEPYFEWAFTAVKNGENLHEKLGGYDYIGGLGDSIYEGENAGMVALSTPGKKGAAEGTDAKLQEVATKLKDGSLKVFDTSKFTYKGKALTSYMADVDFDEAYKGDHEAIKTKNGITFFDESSYRSAPYFNLIIDGIDAKALKKE